MTSFLPSLARAARCLPTLPALLAAAALLPACKPELDSAPTVSAGTANFSHYYAVGNSLTAGYADGGVYREGQLNSYPSILAQQFRRAGGGAFEQPLFSEAQDDGSSHLVLQNFLPSGSPNLVRDTSNTARVLPRVKLPGSGEYVLTPYAGPLNNLGVPGISVADIGNPGYGALNPFYHRLLPDDAARSNTTYLSFLRQKTADATFFTCWLGNNDVLGYATGGAAGGAPTDVTTFAPLYDSALAVLTHHGAKGVCATIPNVTAVPYFTATAMAPTIAAVGARALPAGAPAGARLRLSARKTPLTGVVQVIKPLTANDLFTLPAATILADTATLLKNSTNPLTPGLRLRLRQGEVVYSGTDGSIIAANPLKSDYVLDSLEITRAQAATVALNNVIKATAARYNVPVADMTAFFDGINRDGFATSGITNSTAFISGNLFSLDGVHPAPRGYAVVANELLRVINAAYGAALPYVDAGQYRGVKLP